MYLFYLIIEKCIVSIQYVIHMCEQQHSSMQKMFMKEESLQIFSMSESLTYTSLFQKTRHGDIIGQYC